MKQLNFPIANVIKSSAFYGALMGAWTYLTIAPEVPPMKILVFSAGGGLWFGFGMIPVTWISAKIQSRFDRKSSKNETSGVQ